MPDTLDYMKVTDKNLKAEDAIYDAVVVANYGDPGIDEDYQADILSRFVICKLESINRTLTRDKFKSMLVVVQRPKSLWVNYQGGFLNDPVSQQRVDADLNSNIGAAGSYSAEAIPRTNTPYALGEKIKIKLIKDTERSYLLKEDVFFTSDCNVWDGNSASIGYYQDWHTQGNTNPYIIASNGANNLKMKTVVPTNNQNSSYYITLNKVQYEAFALNAFPNDASKMIKLFNKTSPFNFYYNENGGYVFENGVFNLYLNTLKYEDLNIGGKARTSDTNCVPLVVTSPSTFTVPKVRASGTVNYAPTYIEKA